jgi:signal transduction histidine kinase
MNVFISVLGALIVDRLLAASIGVWLTLRYRRSADAQMKQLEKRLGEAIFKAMPAQSDAAPEVVSGLPS